MSQLSEEDDWESEEFQDALKVVLKCEIQSLLDRLSKAGEETVLLTANPEVLCVSHLASSKAKQFVDSEYVGSIKNKFLYYLTVGDGHQSGTEVCKLPQHTPVQGTNIGRGRGFTPTTTSTPKAGVQHQAAYKAQANKAVPNITSLTSLPNKGVNITPLINKFSVNQSQMLGKRPNESTQATHTKQFNVESQDAKRRKTDLNQPQFPVPKLNFAQNTQTLATTSKAISSNVPHVISVSDEDISYKNQEFKGKPPLVDKSPKVKFTTSKTVSKSGGFTEEKLSEADLKKFLQCYKNDASSELEESEEEGDESYEDMEEFENLEEGELGYVSVSQHQNLQQKAFQQKIYAQNAAVLAASQAYPHVKPESSSVNIKGQVGSPADSNFEMKQDNKTDTVGDVSKLGYKGAISPTNEDSNTSVASRTSALGGAVTDKNVDKCANESGKRTPVLENKVDTKETDNKTVDKGGKFADKSGLLPIKAGLTTAKPEQHMKQQDKLSQSKESQGKVLKNEISSLNTKSSNLLASRKLPDSIDDIDTETLIKMTKEKHKETMSEADKQIQAKLGQLSSKLSWVVEYPRDEKSSGSGSAPGPGPYPKGNSEHGGNYPVAMSEQGAMGEVYHDEENEEDYDEEDDDDYEMTEEEIAQLRAAHMAKMAAAGKTGDRPEDFEDYDEDGLPGERFQVRLMNEDYEEEGYEDGELNAEGEEQANYGEYGEYREEGMMPEGEHLGVGEDGMVHYEQHLQPDAFAARQPYQRSSSPTLDNFLLTGSLMGKCLVCNKIVRKTEFKQHNQTHIEEEEEDLEEEGEDEEGYLEEGEEGDEYGDGGGAGGGYMDTGEGPIRGFLDTDPEGLEYHLEGAEEYEEEFEDSDIPEFTAEKMEVENSTHVGDINASTVKISDKANKSTTCDICEKEFKSFTNMKRHRKIHETSKDIDCPVAECKKVFRLHTYLTKHMRKMHPDVPIPSAAKIAGGSGQSETEDQFLCGECDETFTNNEALMEHVQIHT